MNYHAPWATLPEALQALNTVPLDPKTYDFIDQLTATYHAQPFDPVSPRQADALPAELTAHVLATCILYQIQAEKASPFFEKNEKIQKIHEIERTTVKEICKCGRAFPCRIHGFVVY